MFGFTFIIFIGFCCIVASIRDTNHDNRLRDKAARNSNMYYTNSDGSKQRYWIDRRGAMRLQGTDRHVSVHTDIDTGDTIIVDVKTGKVLSNLTENSRSAYIRNCRETAIKNGRTVYPIEDGSVKNEINGLGRKYKDVNTGDIYVIRVVSGNAWYVRVSDGIFVKKVWDESTNIDEKFGLYNPHTIRLINEQQKLNPSFKIGKRESLDAWRYPLKKED